MLSIKSLMEFVFPPRCLVCDGLQGLLAGIALCQDCLADIRVNHSACWRCAAPLYQQASASSKLLCGECLQHPPPYEHCWSAFIYAQPLEWMIQQLKFHNKLAFAPLLSAILSPGLDAFLGRTQAPQAIIPVPLHVSRLKQRGYNQAQILIEPLAKAMGMSVDVDSCQRVRATEHQTGLRAEYRRENIKRAFSFNNSAAYEHVAIFDDVITTGSTVQEMSRELLRQGVNRVDVWSLARADKLAGWKQANRLG